MTGKSNRTEIVSDRALEMIMRDVLDGLLEVALESCHSFDTADMSILEITPPRSKSVAHEHREQPAEVIDFPTPKRAYG